MKELAAEGPLATDLRHDQRRPSADNYSGVIGVALLRKVNYDVARKSTVHVRYLSVLVLIQNHGDIEGLKHPRPSGSKRQAMAVVVDAGIASFVGVGVITLQLLMKRQDLVCQFGILVIVDPCTLRRLQPDHPSPLTLRG